MNLTLVPFGEPVTLQHFMFLERPEEVALEGGKGIDAPVHEAVPLMAVGDIVPQLPGLRNRRAPVPLDRARSGTPC